MAAGACPPTPGHPTRLREYGVDVYSDASGAPVYFPSGCAGRGYYVDDEVLKGTFVSSRNRWLLVAVLASVGMFFGWLVCCHTVRLLPALVVAASGLLAREIIVGGRIRKSMRLSPMRLSMADVYIGKAQDFAHSGLDVWSVRYRIIVLGSLTSATLLLHLQALSFLPFLLFHVWRWSNIEYLAWVARRIARQARPLPFAPAWVLLVQALMIGAVLLCFYPPP